MYVEVASQNGHGIRAPILASLQYWLSQLLVNFYQLLSSQKEDKADVAQSFETLALIPF